MSPSTLPFDSVRQTTRTALAVGEPEAAVENLEAHLQSHPGDRAAHLDARILCERLYRFDAALAHALAPDDPAPIVQAAQMQFGRARFGEALALLRDVTPPASAPAAALVMAAEVAERAEQLDAALDFAHAALRRAPDQPRAVRLIAHIERRRGDLPAAQARLEARLRAGSFPDRWRLLYELAAVRDRLGDCPGAFAAMDEAKRLLASAAAPFAEPARAVWQRQREIAEAVEAADYRRWAQDADELPPRRLVVLAGHPRSGTTMLEQRLAASPDAIGTDESGVFNREFAASLLYRAPGSAREALAEWRAWEPDELAAARDTFWQLTEAVLGEPIGPRLLIEKDPLRTPDLPLFVRLFPETKILLPLRHPCDVALSVWMTLVPLHREGWPASSLAAALESVAHTLTCWRLLRDRLPQAWREVRYENLTANPNRELADLRTFLAVPDSPATPAPPSPRGISTPSYLEAGGAVHSRSVGRWKHSLRQTPRSARRAASRLVSRVRL